ncbi:hypothetical protein VTO42DRAFT_1184 [Malbranchea cinnamomea]
MVVYYTVAGRKVGSHVLAMATLATTFAGAWLALPSKDKTQPPPINASSQDEEKFIQEFLKNVEAEEKKAKH